MTHIATREHVKDVHVTHMITKQIFCEKKALAEKRAELKSKSKPASALDLPHNAENMRKHFEG